MMTSIELFAGIAGFSSPHIQPIAFVEKEPSCQLVLRRHYAGVPIFDDVRDCGAHNLPWANVIKFGFPCQDLSVAGNRAGLGGKRSGLFYEATRIVDELRPDYAVWENVPGLLSGRGGKDFAAVLLELARIGYSGCWTCLDAQFFGVAQRRQRIFGVFARSDIGTERTTKILSLADRMPWHSQASAETWPDVAATIRSSSASDGINRPGRRGDDDVNVIAIRTAQTSSNGWGIDESGTAYTLDNTNSNAGLLPEPFTFDWQQGVASDNDRSWMVDKPGRTRALTANRTLATIGALTAANGGPDDTSAQAGHVVATALTAPANGQRIDGTTETFVTAFTERTRPDGRTLETQDDLAYALTNPGGGGRAHSRSIAGNFGVRRLTPVECERLQGFADGWTAYGVDANGRRVDLSDSARYRMLGNAVCKNVSAWIDSQIVKHHDD